MASDDAPLRALAECRGLADAEAKASCYDAAAAALEEAVRTGELLIVQRRQAQAAQRSAFGFSLPALSILDRSGNGSEPLESVTGEARRAYQDPLGRWIVELTDGAVWRQIDNEVVSPRPRSGSRIEVRRAAFGSYLMRIDGQRGVRAKRAE
jgi:hypothetical protein